MFYFITIVFQNSFKDIFKNIGAQIADVGVVIDGGAAGIEANLFRLKRLERLDLAGKGVVEVKRHMKGLKGQRMLFG